MNTKMVRKEQLELAQKIITSDEYEKIKTIAGTNIVYSKEEMAAVIVVLDFKTKKLIETKHYITKPRVNYRPTYLAYREAPAIVQAYSMLETKPDILIVNSHGILHPRRIGCASHIGLLLDIPTIGVAKNKLCGEVDGTKIICNGEIRGVLMHTKRHANPIFVSPGHRISLSSSMEIVTKCLDEGFKMPYPLRVAHKKGLAIKKTFQ